MNRSSTNLSAPLKSAKAFLRQSMTTVSEPSSLKAMRSPLSATGRKAVAMLQMERKVGEGSSPLGSVWEEREGEGEGRGRLRSSMLGVPL